MLTYKNKNICGRGGLLSFLTILGLTLSAGGCPPKSQSKSEQEKTKVLQLLEGSRKITTILRQKTLPEIKKVLNTDEVKELEKAINEWDQEIQKGIKVTKDLTEADRETETGARVTYVEQMQHVRDKYLEIDRIKDNIYNQINSGKVKATLANADKDIENIKSKDKQFYSE
ncbi:hypothetical protein [Candidatus Cardinium hertigii]|jgi:hypothetical protein|uniref:Lipoprotein n=1 Tax=Candidatus Cardinium hertigii TaxID=247481 RepID=A0A3N2QCH5_9BACT|nr:hypothetical protein [Candidatus Cardinium hertigii]ROT47312.1 hypothetical protein EDM02_02605 [Candidatus Cardinium hertigii]